MLSFFFLSFLNSKKKKSRVEETTGDVALWDEDHNVELLRAAHFCTVDVARNALRRCDNDLVNALLFLSSSLLMEAASDPEKLAQITTPRAPASGADALAPPIPTNKPKITMGARGRVVAPRPANDNSELDSGAGEVDSFAQGLSVALKTASKRYSIVEELLVTERAYQKGLVTLRDQFAKPLATMEKPLSSIVSLRSLLDGLLPASAEFLRMLEQCLASWSETALMSVCFPKKTLGAFEALYFNYMQSCQEVMRDLQEKEKEDSNFTQLLKTLQRSGVEGTQDIRSHLILPVQRLPRYELLLRQLVQLTPNEHPDYAGLQTAIQDVVALNRNINERMRKGGQVALIRKLRARFVTDPGFKDEMVLLKEGDVVKKTSTGRLEKRILFLFSGFLAYAKVNLNKTLVLSTFVPLSRCKIMDVPDEANQWGFELKVIDGKVSKIYLPSLEKKMEWMQAITNATADDIARLPAGTSYRPPEKERPKSPRDGNKSPLKKKGSSIIRRRGDEEPK